ncbi:protein AIM2 [Favolaschia claudopus]|uniref:Protein AIM2 n=1 Tax=Favolaschia claudopus TaxID=2862362 RepID=A0AAW0CJH9_9AGAR
MASEKVIISHPYCKDCIGGIKHTGDPVGRTETIADVPTYVSDPSSEAADNGPKKVVMFFSDVYGPLYINNKLLQDYFASRGFHVVGIDYFMGDPISNHNEPGFKWEEWLDAKRKLSAEITPKWIQAIRERYGMSDAKYSAVGYCYGGPFALDLAGTEDVVAAAFAHPGLLTEDQFQNIKKPLLMSCAESDFTFTNEFRRRAEDILAEVKAQYFMQLFCRVQHGFAVRGNMENPDERWAKEESARGIIDWFERFSV